MKNNISEAITRIHRMEIFFREILEVLHNEPEKLHTVPVQKKIEILSDYYENGEWLKDYELDEQHLLPTELPRGVLSQDGLYNLLSDLLCTKK